MIAAAALVAIAGTTVPGVAIPVLANPASVYCVTQGGRLAIVQGPNGQRGLCVLPNGRRVDEWRFFRARNRM